MTEAAVWHFLATCKVFCLTGHQHVALRLRFLIGREKPGTQSEVARLISETLEQEKNQQQQQHMEDPYEHSTEEVSPRDSFCSAPPHTR